MKIFLIILAIAAVKADEDFGGLEWEKIDGSQVLPVLEVPGIGEESNVRPIDEIPGLPDVHIPPRPFNSANERQGRIVGGRDANAHEFPHAVAILAKMNGTSTRGLCGGSIITLKTILTVAHCLGPRVESVTIIAGAHNIYRFEPNQQRRIETPANFRIHEMYNKPVASFNDIATILLASTAFGQGPLTWAPQVQAVDLPRDRLMVESFYNDTATTVGWGACKNCIGGFSRVLRTVDNRIMANLECKPYFAPDLVTDNSICIDTSGGNSPCLGDSGSPMTITRNGKRVLVGMPSVWSYDGCANGKPANCERVSGHLAWIDANSAA